MFGLTKREQRWAAEQKVAEVIIPAITEIVVERLKMDTNERIAALTVERDEALIAGSRAITDLAKVKADLAECQMLESAVAGMHRETLASLAVMKAERDAVVAALKQIADPNAFLHSGDDASLARRYEEIAQAALSACKEEGE